MLICKVSCSIHYSVLFQETDLPVPSAHTLSLLSLDGLEDMDSVETNATRSDYLIILNVVPGLPPRRLWNSTVLAYGCQDHPILSGVELSELIIVSKI